MSAMTKSATFPVTKETFTKRDKRFLDSLCEYVYVCFVKRPS